jgi:hypothetical protein
MAATNEVAKFTDHLPHPDGGVGMSGIASAAVGAYSVSFSAAYYIYCAHSGCGLHYQRLL